MAGGNVYGGSNMNVLLHNQSLSGSSQALESLWCPNSSTKLHGLKHLVNVGDNKRGRNADRQLLTSLSKDDYNDEDFDDCFQQPGKKRRLTVDQVQFLERNFEIENKLDPERKVQLAKEVRLQPRQVAIWFQNRRARFKTKQLEKEYDCLKASYDKLKTDFDNLLKDNEKLKDEVHSLKDKLTRDSGKENQENVDHNATNSSNSESPGPNGVLENSANFTVIACKQEDASSAKSDIFDPDSPHYMDGINSSFLEPAYSSDVFESDNNCSFLEPAYSSNIFEPDQSDFSQDDDDNFSKSLLQTHYFPKLEEGVDDLSFPIEEQLFCFWP